jgi:hypothetical protein
MNPMKRMLLTLEAEVHKGGWDQPTIFGLLVRGPGMLGITPFPDFPKAHPPSVIDAFTRDLVEDPAGCQRLITNNPGIFGAILVDEGWSPPADATKEQIDQARRSRLRYADMLDAREVRMVCSIDIQGTMWMITRIRGERPRIDKVSTAGFQVGGMVWQALRNFLIALTPPMPNGQEIFYRLTAIEFENEPELMRQWRAEHHPESVPASGVEPQPDQPGDDREDADHQAHP